MKVLVVCTVALVVCAGCSGRKSIEKEEALLMEIDRAFSALSVEKGRHEAFDRFMADDAVIFRDGEHPYEGRDAIRELLSRSGGTLRWEPYFADVSLSGDLGYTLGTYEFAYVDEIGVEQISYGYYVSIWKREPGGHWRYVFDSGIESPPPTK
jgi:ketosteroid isomerase-like protein